MAQTLVQRFRSRREEFSKVQKEDTEQLAKQFDQASKRFSELARECRDGESGLLESYLRAVEDTQHGVWYAMLLVEISSIRRDEINFVVSETERDERERTPQRPDTESILEALEILQSRIKAL